MHKLDAGIQKRLVAISRKNLQLDEPFRMTIWISALPIFKFISKNPLIRSLGVSLVLLIITIITNYDKITLIFLAKQTSIFAEVFIGFYAGFYFSDVTNDGYDHLLNITLLPKDTFRRWFAKGISVSYGRANILSSEARKNYHLKDVIKNDREICLWFLGWIIFILPTLFVILKLPRELSLGAFVQYAFIFFWCYTWLWTPHWVIYSIGFLVKLAKLPVRYFWGIPDNLTLKGVGAVVVRLNYMAFLHFLFLIPFLYLWEVIPHQSSEFKTINPIIILTFLIAFAAYVTISCFCSAIITQIAITKSMKYYKNKKYAEYANRLEVEFNSYMRQPTASNMTSLLETKKNMRMLRKLPVFGLYLNDFIKISTIFAIDMALIFYYFKFSFLSWENFFNIFQAYL